MNSILDISREFIVKIYQENHTKDYMIEGKINALKLWCNQQAHFPQIHDERILQQYLMKNSFSLERTKEALENYFTVRQIYKKYYGPSNGHFEPYSENFLILPLPKLTVNNDRIIYAKITNPHLGQFNYDRAISQFALTLEYLAWNDYVRKIIVVMDCENFTFDHMKQVSLSQLAAICDLLQRGYSNQMSGIIYINTPSFAHIALDMLKRILTSSTYEMVKPLKGVEGLYETILKKNCFPREYGGDLPPIEVLLKQWNRVFKENVPLFDQCYDFVSDESKRIPTSDPGEEYIGSGTTGSYFQLQNVL